MKELDQFTVERLEEIRNSFLDQIQEKAPSIEEVFALIDIALSVKQAEPVAWKWRGAVGDIWTQEKRKADFVTEHCPELPVTKLYATPPANPLVVPEGWKVFKGNEDCIVVQKNSNHWTTLKDGNITTCEKILLGYFSDMLATAPTSLLEGESNG